MRPRSPFALLVSAGLWSSAFSFSPLLYWRANQSSSARKSVTMFPPFPFVRPLSSSSLKDSCIHMRKKAKGLKTRKANLLETWDLPYAILSDTHTTSKLTPLTTHSAQLPPKCFCPPPFLSRLPLSRSRFLLCIRFYRLSWGKTSQRCISLRAQEHGAGRFTWASCYSSKGSLLGVVVSTITGKRPLARPLPSSQPYTTYAVLILLSFLPRQVTMTLRRPRPSSIITPQLSQ